MVICWIALPIFAVLSIFSVKYRQLTKDAISCFFHNITLRRCQSGLDKRIKSHITGTVLKLSPKAAKFVYNYYALLSWLFVIFFVASTIFLGIGIYNYALYGNCNGPDSTGFCIFDPTGANSECSTVPTNVTNSIIPEVDDTDPMRGNPDASLTIIEFGCYTCPYTEAAEKTVKEVLEKYDGKVNLQFRSFVLPNHPLSRESALAAECAFEQDKYWEYHDALFALPEFQNDTFINLARQYGLNETQFNQCMDSPEANAEIDADIKEGMKAGIAGTPTFFVNNQSILGPKPIRTFTTVINQELNKK